MLSKDLSCWSGDPGLAGAREEYHNLGELSNMEMPRFGSVRLTC